MKLEYITFKKLDEAATAPTRYNVDDAGLDIYSLRDVFIPHGSTKVVSTGIALKVPVGYVGKIFDRSSMGLKGLAVGAGVVDSGYNGEISIVFHNLTNKEEHDFKDSPGYWVKGGDKIAQLCLIPVATPSPVEVFELWDSERGNKGWGSSNR